MALDMTTKYYNKKKPSKIRKYFNTPDELFLAEGRKELIGKHICPSWLGVKNITINI